ncbi:hypothetical protein B296_00030248, partial [Ensete ventricosum]
SSSSSPFRILPRLPPRRFRRHGRCRLSLLRCSVSDAPAVDPSVFGGPKELSGPQALVCALPPPVRMASSAVLAVAAMAAGFGLGLRVGGSKVAGIGGAAVLGVAGGAAVYALNSKIPEVAAINLHNLVAGYDDPTELTKDEVAAIVEKYGVNKQDDAFKAEICDLYSRFVSSVLPPGSENLKGYEVEMIIRFKEALGIDDPDAASVHVEIGRHIYRQRLGWLSSSYGLTLATKLDGAQVGTVLAMGRNLASAFAGAEQDISCSARRSSLKGIVVSETSSGKNTKRKVAPT